MSDLVATTCGYERDNGCSSIIWIILLLCLCNNGSPFGGDRDGFGGDNCCIWIILLLCCCGKGRGGNGFF